MSRLPCSTIRASVLGGLLGIVLSLLLILLGLGALAFGIGSDSGIVGRTVGLSISAMTLFGAFAMGRMAFSPGGRLRVEVCEDAIEFHQGGRPPAVVRRNEIERVVLNESRFEGVESFVVYGPGGSVLGTWQTGWFVKPPFGVLRALKKHGYPCGLQNPLYKDRLFYENPGRRADES